MALGGAHTLVLAEKKTQPSKANPWGTHRLLFAFGYGRNGQLGTGVLADEYLPVSGPNSFSSKRGLSI